MLARSSCEPEQSTDKRPPYVKHLVGRDYSWASSIFYFGYISFSYPASFFMVRLPIGKYLAATRYAVP